MVDTTSIMQSMDMCVIKNWKAHYKSRLNTRIINAMDSDLSLRALDRAKSISLLDVLYNSKLSWDAVEGRTIAKCFQKSGFVEDSLISSSQDDTSNHDNKLDDVLLSSNMSLEEFKNFIDIDNDIPVSGELSNEELMEISRKKMVDYLRIFIQSNGLDNVFTMLNETENKVHIEAINAKQ